MSAVRCILKGRYKGYEEALDKLGLVTLDERRAQMCLKFAKQCLKLDKMNRLFPRNQKCHAMDVRSSEFYKVTKDLGSLQYHQRYKCLMIIRKEKKGHSKS